MEPYTAPGLEDEERDPANRQDWREDVPSRWEFEDDEGEALPSPDWMPW